MSAKFLYRRPQLAASIADYLLDGAGAIYPPAGESGLFLHGDRRTGKTTFLKGDLVAEIESRGAAAIYVDLAEDRSRQTTELLCRALKRAFVERGRTWGRLASVLASVRKLNITAGAKIGFELEKIGEAGGPTVSEALGEFARRTGKPLVLVLDNAEHAAASEDGRNMLLALKAARDALNGGSSRLRLAVIGVCSDRSKALELTGRNEHAFYGATHECLPRLDREFVAAFMEAELRPRIKPECIPDNDAAWFAFSEIVAFKPEGLRDTARRYVMTLQQGATDDLSPNDSFVVCANAVRDEWWQAMVSKIYSLSDKQLAVFKVMAQDGEDFAPFNALTHVRCSEEAGLEISEKDMLPVLKHLVDSKFVWNPSPGVYRVDDPLLARILVAQESSGLPLESIGISLQDESPGAPRARLAA